MKPPTDDPILEEAASEFALPEYDPFEPCPRCFQPGPASTWWENE